MQKNIENKSPKVSKASDEKMMIYQNLQSGTVKSLNL